jgi:hypothetical protein
MGFMERGPNYRLELGASENRLVWTAGIVAARPLLRPKPLEVLRNL